MASDSHDEMRGGVAADVRASSSEAAAPSAGAQGSGRRRVLIVDDETLVAAALRRCLVRQHDITVSCEPEQALSDLRAGARYDVILCDLMMPRLSGSALLLALSDFAPEQAARVVLMTGGIPTGEVRELLARTRTRCITKPCSVQELRDVVESTPPWCPAT